MLKPHLPDPNSCEIEVCQECWDWSGTWAKLVWFFMQGLIYSGKMGIFNVFTCLKHCAWTLSCSLMGVYYEKCGFYLGVLVFRNYFSIFSQKNLKVAKLKSAGQWYSEKYKNPSRQFWYVKGIADMETPNLWKGGSSVDGKGKNYEIVSRTSQLAPVPILLVTLPFNSDSALHDWMRGDA